MLGLETVFVGHHIAEGQGGVVNEWSRIVIVAISVAEPASMHLMGKIMPHHSNVVKVSKAT